MLSFEGLSGLSSVRLGWDTGKYCQYDFFSFRFYSSFFMSYMHAQYPEYSHLSP
jgi:hypothetical protein